MDFLINDLSIHGQFNTASDFVKSVDTVMAIRQTIHRAGRAFFCHRGLSGARVTALLTMPQAIQEMPEAKRRAWMQWLTKQGPYWQDERQHSGDDWLECEGDPIYTDHAIGEAGFCILHGSHREVVSIDPSDWLRTPITLSWLKEEASKWDIRVANHWAVDTVTEVLERLPRPFDSWASLEEHVRRSRESIVIADDAFEPLAGYPYVKSVAESIANLLHVLDKMNAAFDENGQCTAEYNRLYQTYFVGSAPYFTDESDTNKRDYRSKLTFPDPVVAGESLFCSWHGKVNSPSSFPPIRIHFTWPTNATNTVCVVYVGPKITTR